MRTFRDFKPEERRNYITLSTGEYYPDILEDACRLYSPVLETFSEILHRSESSNALFMNIASVPNQWMRTQLCRVFRKYVSPETPVEMLKKNTKAKQICMEFGNGFRPIHVVQDKFDSRPFPDEAICAVLWEYKDRGKKGYDLTEKFFDMIRQKVLMTEGPILDNAPAGGEGLGNKLKNSIRMCSDREQLAQMLKSKRYTRTRIDRFLAQTVLCMDRREYAANYIRVLAFNDRGREYLKEIKKSDICCLPVITNINKEAAGYPQIAYSLSRDILAADLYNMAAGRDMYRFSEYVRKPFCMD